MSDPGSEIDEFLASLPDKLEQEIAAEFADAVEEIMVEPIRDAAPEGERGHLKASVRKDPGRDDFEWIVEAGGPLTTKPVRDGATATYDYAEGVEFGNSHMNAEPFFWPTVRVQQQPMQERCEEILDNAMQKLGG